MSDKHPPPLPPSSKSEPELQASHLSANLPPGDATHASSVLLGDGASETQTVPGLSRSPSFSNSSAHGDMSDADEGSFFPPVERLTMFDFIGNLALPQRVEKIQSSWQADRKSVV